jgi:hypothetical protein
MTSLTCPQRRLAAARHAAALPLTGYAAAVPAVPAVPAVAALRAAGAPRTPARLGAAGVER